MIRTSSPLRFCAVQPDTIGTEAKAAPSAPSRVKVRRFIVMRSSLLYLAVQAGQKCEYLGGRCCGMVDHLTVAADFHLEILETSIDEVKDVAHLGLIKKIVHCGGKR